MDSHIIYIENFVENTSGLPPELQRVVNTIKALDEKVSELSASIDNDVAACLAMPAQHSAPDGGAEVAKLRQLITEQQRLMVLYADEKVALANQGLDLIAYHDSQLERDMKEFTEDFNTQSMLQSGFSTDFASALDEAPSKAMGTAYGGRSSRAAEELPARRDGDGGRRVSRMAAEYDMSGANTPVEAPAPKKGGQKGPRDQSAFAQAQPVGQGYANLAGTPTLQGSRKKAARNRGVVQQDLGLAGSQDITAMAPPFPLPHGLQHSALRPQCPGTLLREVDVNENLVGRRAEMFWPEDNLWYMIIIENVDLMQRTAAIYYSTGESETLNLDEIIRDSHMSLLPPDFGM